MVFGEILLIALGLALDAFAVSLGAGASGRVRGRRAAFRLSFHFGLFQFFMPILGWLAGRSVVSLIAPVDHWVAFGLLVLVGTRMIHGGKNAEAQARPIDPSRGWNLVLLSIATSIDALAIGLSLALLQVRIWYPCAVIGLVTATLSWLGLRFGHRLGVRFGRRMEVAGGLLLYFIGLRILLAELIFGP
jgi:putative Mn2+ efflux pump MntP